MVIELLKVRVMLMFRPTMMLGVIIATMLTAVTMTMMETVGEEKSQKVTSKKKLSEF